MKRLVAARGLISDALWVGLTQVLGVVAGVAMVVIGANVLTVEDFAALTWGLAWIAYLGVVARFGSMHASAVVVARAAGQPRRTSVLLLLTPAALGLCLCVVWYVGLGDLILSVTKDGEAYTDVASLIGVWIPVATLGPTIGAILRALGHFRASTGVGDWVRRAVIAVALLVLHATGNVSLVDAMWLGIGAELVLVIVALAVVLRGRPDTSPTEAMRWGTVAKWSRSFYVLSVAGLMIPQSGVWLVSLLGDSGEVANFGLAVRFAVLFSLPFFVGSRVFAPRIARAAHSGDVTSLQPALRAFATAASVVIMVALIGFIVVGRWLIETVFGSEFSGSYVPAVLLASAAVVNAATGLNRTVLVNAGDAWFVTSLVAASAALFLLLGVIIGRPLGATGVAIAALVAQVTQDLVMLRAAQHSCRVRTGMDVRLTAMRRLFA